MYQHGDTVIAKAREDGSCSLNGGYLDVVKKTVSWRLVENT
jgi:hypothetical protein